MTAYVNRVPFWDDENILELDNSDHCKTLWIYWKPWCYIFSGWILWYVNYSVIKIKASAGINKYSSYYFMLVLRKRTYTYWGVDRWMADNRDKEQWAVQIKRLKWEDQ